MELQPLQIKEAVGGVIKMEAVDNGGTAIIQKWLNVHPNDEGVVSINGNNVGEFLVGQALQFPLEVSIPKKVFLDHSGQGPVKFIYTVFGGSDGNPYPSLPVSYSIELAL